MSNVLVSGAGDSNCDGVYTETGTFGGRAYYNLSGTDPGTWAIADYYGYWAIYADYSSGPAYLAWVSADTPWDSSSWSAAYGPEPAPTVTEYVGGGGGGGSVNNSKFFQFF